MQPETIELIFTILIYVNLLLGSVTWYVWYSNRNHLNQNKKKDNEEMKVITLKHVGEKNKDAGLWMKKFVENGN